MSFDEMNTIENALSVQFVGELVSVQTRMVAEKTEEYIAGVTET